MQPSGGPTGPSPLGLSGADPSLPPGEAPGDGRPRSLQQQLADVSVLSFTPKQVAKEGMRVKAQVRILNPQAEPRNPRP